MSNVSKPWIDRFPGPARLPKDLRRPLGEGIAETGIRAVAIPRDTHQDTEPGTACEVVLRTMPQFHGRGRLDHKHRRVHPVGGAGRDPLARSGGNR